MITINYINQKGCELDVVKTLFNEYANELNENLCFQHFEEELEDPLKKYGQPLGSLLLAYCNNEPAGCIALQPLPQQGVCEMKRLYVRNQYRNQGIADELVNIILKEAKDKGYQKMVLDTLERLQAAVKLYTKHGFVNTSAYYANPLPAVVYMEKQM